MNRICKYVSFSLFLVALFFSFSWVVKAQDNRSYGIDSFDVTFKINQDSTIDVVEDISYDFKGTYNKGWRSISHKDISAITDIYIVNKLTGKKLTYTSNRLEKTNPANWGKYTYKVESGFTNIEWYYNATNEKQVWEIHYVIHGLIGFYKNNDELYWNLFTDYEVPINSVTAKVILPTPVDLVNNRYPGTLYRTFPKRNNNQYIFERYGDNGFVFSSGDIASQETVTIALDFPKGIVNQNSFWVDWVKLNLGWILGLFLIFLTSFFVFIRWFFGEYLPKHDKSIVPQYEPPNDLKPAEMGIIYHEHLSKKTWPATIVDLAVKGYVKIEEKDPKKMVTNILFTIFSMFIGFIFIVYGLRIAIKIYEAFVSGSSSPLFAGIFFIFVISLFGFSFKKRYFSKEYVITLQEESFMEDPDLEDYEKSFISNLFDGRKSFSTYQIKFSQDRAQGLHYAMLELEKNILSEIVFDRPNVYKNSLELKNKIPLVLIGLCFVNIISFFLFVSIEYFQGFFIVLEISISVLLYFLFVKLNPQLSTTGNQLWRDIEGFRWYLKTAERYRLQNLTPELFEKFLPYAIIFGVEKKWASHFEGIIGQPPAWYGTSHGYTGVGAGAAFSSGGFSIGSFSNSFSSSFSSAFSSSGGSGGSGGGFGGGGGGAGGGGAS